MQRNSLNNTTTGGSKSIREPNKSASSTGVGMYSKDYGSTSQPATLSSQVTAYAKQKASFNNTRSDATNAANTSSINAAKTTAVA